MLVRNRDQNESTIIDEDYERGNSEQTERKSKARLAGRPVDDEANRKRERQQVASVPP